MDGATRAVTAMRVARGHLGVDGLNAVARAAFGGARRLSQVERLRGGTKKGVYRLTLDDGSTSVAYVWNDDEDYWPAATGTATPAAGPAVSGPAARAQTGQDHSDPFGHPTGVELFTSAHAAMSALGVRVPRIELVDRSETLVAGDVAVVEDVRGGTLEQLCARDRRRAEQVLGRLGDTVRAMHRRGSPVFGRPAAAESGVGPGLAQDPPVERLVLERALRHLSCAAERVERIAAAEHQLSSALHERFAAVQPRATFGLIHGELGPDHVFVDDNDDPVIIDIEGVMHFDVEWEHAFLELRFHDDYRHFADAELDQARMRLYRLAMHLSLVEGPLRLLDGDFPNRALMLGIVEHSVGCTLSQLP